MDAKYIALLLAILLAISVYFNIQCDWGELKPEDAQLSIDTIDPKQIQLTDLKLCLQGQNGDSCIGSFDGMKGGAIKMEKILSMVVDTNINCLSFAYMYSPDNGQLKLVFHGNRYEDDGSGRMVIRYLPGPSYGSDWMCPTICPN